MTNRNFDMTNFEQSLKDHADQFFIVPSRRIWTGLYNNLHPGSKWPSFAMGLVFILTLVSIGHLNSPESRNARQITQNSFTVADESSKLNTAFMFTNAPIKNVANTNYWPVQFKFWKNTSHNSNKQSLDKKLIADNSNAQESFNSPEGIALKNYSPNPIQILPNKESSNSNKNLLNNSNHFPSAKQVALYYDKQKNNSSNSKNVNQEVFDNSESSINLDKNSDEEKIVWTYYITPSFSSGGIPGITTNTPANDAGNTLPKDGNLSVMYNNQIGIETGTQIAFKFDDRWQFITGASLMYSGYQMTTNTLIPETQNLTLQPSNQNPSSINNYRLQASIPLGVQYQVWKTNGIQINIASTIEPSFLITSDIYTLSSDGKSYVNSPDILRRVNLSGNLGSYISFGSKNIKWQIGPTIRYHILSNFKNGITSGDHLFDYGIRIGISK